MRLLKREIAILIAFAIGGAGYAEFGIVTECVPSHSLRGSSVRDLLTTFRNSTRNPFPNWAGD